MEKTKNEKPVKEMVYDGVIFTGHMAAGKTFYSNRLIEMLNRENLDNFFIEKVSIAEKLKSVATDLFGMKEKDRRLLQMLGAKMREIDKDVWIKYMAKEIQKGFNDAWMPNYHFVLDDCRFLNELDYLKKITKNGKPIKLFIIKLEPSLEDRMLVYEKIYGRKPTKEEMEDATEAEIDKLPYDYKINAIYHPTFAEKEIEKLKEYLIKTK